MENRTTKFVIFIFLIMASLVLSGCASSGSGSFGKKDKKMPEQEKIDVTKSVIEDFFKQEGFSVNVEIKDLDGNGKPDFVVDVSGENRNFHWEDAIALVSGAVCGCKTELDFSIDKIFLINNDGVRMITANAFDECCTLIITKDSDDAKTGECLENGFLVME